MNSKDYIQYFCLILLVVDQFFYFKTGSYIYRYGFKLYKFKNVYGYDALSAFGKRCIDLNKFGSGLCFSNNAENKEIYFRCKYPFFIIGPLIFTGQIKFFNDESFVYIRISFITVFIIFISIAIKIYTFNFEIADIFIVILLVYIFFKFIQSYNKIISILKY